MSSFTPADLDFLVSDRGAALTSELLNADLRDALAVLTRLRKTHSPEEARTALTLAQLRQKGVTKFGAQAARMFFTPDALEQASDPLIRQYRSQQIDPGQLIDACCGIGSDALAFAAAGSRVTGIDLDPLRVRMARYNAAAWGVDAVFEVGDVTQDLPPGDVIFFDPARRDEQGKRLFDAESYQPPLSLVRRWQARQIVVKLSPGVDLAQVQPYGGTVEFISVAGDLKEAVLWLGDERGGLRATLLLDATRRYHWDTPVQPAEVVLSEPRQWLLEPDPAILRAGLVADLALALDACQLDPTIAYLTSDSLPESPWVRGWRVLDWMPLHLKKLRAYLKARDVGRVTVKKRGVSLAPEEVIASLKLKGAHSVTLVLTRCAGQHIVLICADQAGLAQ